ncbi:hypothetical protein [Mycolicibacter virginiensis]|uniref:hypothetical protein n=1 Tax=Mycolicibacter virginiensis TaxID=1795032 RepID=UPI001F044775|nr:hypothetical protein [Mycolicibacter virginiensis]ULP48608.1 hypothetical protein MJO54_05725 [Mycolicibacter virginiensis]
MKETNSSRNPSMAPKDSREATTDFKTGAMRCTARSSRTGEPCKRPPMLGGNVCYHHGGAAPQVKAKAQRRLEQSCDSLVQKLLGMALDGDVPDHVALAAIRDALDRAMGKATATVEVSAKPAWEEVMNDIVGVAHITQAESQARQGLLPDEPRALPAPDDDLAVIDAEVVDTATDRGPRGRTPADRPDDPTGPDATATGHVRPPGRELATLEDATADAAAANRAAARLGRVRRMR